MHGQQNITNSFYVMCGRNRCLFWDKYKTKK